MASCLGSGACSLHGSWSPRAHSHTKASLDLCCTFRQPHSPVFSDLAPAHREQNNLRAQPSAGVPGSQSPRQSCSLSSETLPVYLAFFLFFKQGTAMELRLALSAQFSCLSLRSAGSQVYATTPSSTSLLKGHSSLSVWFDQGRAESWGNYLPDLYSNICYLPSMCQAPIYE